MKRVMHIVVVAACASPHATVDSAGGSCPTTLTWSAIAGSPAGSSELATTVIGGTSATDIWTLGASGISRGDGATWHAMPIGCAAINGFWVAGPNSVFATIGCTHAGDNDILHWDGTTWTPFNSSDNRIVNAYWGTGLADVWGATTLGNGYSGHWDGTTWIHGGGVSGLIAGGAPGDVWGADAGGLAHMAMGAVAAPVAWSTLGVDSAACFPGGTSPACVHAGWASATNDVWFVGDGGKAFHFDGASWSVLSTPASAALRGVWGTSAADAWAVGDGGAIVHYDGSAWHDVPSPTTNALFGVWASSACDVWAIGDAIYHAH